ncbi:TPA: hypothetical protein HA344_05015 [Candidatus Bathyarchaeota archaeon]|nr:hypothetical protein [Candidatus Bathyarchaeota archaeon]
MLANKDDYLSVEADYDCRGLEIRLNGNAYKVDYPAEVWESLHDDAKKMIVDHVAFMSTNYLPVVLDKKGVVYGTRQPMLESFAFESTVFDIPSCAQLDGRSTMDYLRRYYNSDFRFEGGETVVWGKKYRPRNKAIVSFTSGKESLLTLALCRELGIEPILVNVVEPSNIYEEKHRRRLLEEMEAEFGVEWYMVRHEPGVFHDGHKMGYKPSSLGWGTQLLYYLFLYLPFIFHSRARYVFFGNENSCDKEAPHPEGFRTNYCFDQSSRWTLQMDNAARMLTGGSARVGSLVGPLNEIAVTKVLHEGYPDLAKYQMSCFCEDPPAEEHRWCCTCSKCARTYAFIRGLGYDPTVVGFWKDVFTEEHANLFSALGGEKTFGFDKSGLGREEQELALYMAAQREPDNLFLRKYMKTSMYNGIAGEGGAGNERFHRDYEAYMTPQPYEAMPDELRDRVYAIYRGILSR